MAQEFLGLSVWEEPASPPQHPANKMMDPVASRSSLVGSQNSKPGDGNIRNEPSQCTWDIGANPPFWSVENSDRLPFMHAFGAGPLHGFSAHGDWDLHRAAEEFPDAIYRSLRSGRDDGREGDWQTIIFQFGPQCFLCVDSKSAVAYATNVDAAKAVFLAFDEAYRIVESSPSGGYFQLLKVTYDVQCETVLLSESTVLSEEEFTLRYGVHGLEWHTNFVEQLRTRDRGISILEGTPGTGKTHYLRHLMSVLRATHRFYFLPPNNLSSLSQPEFIEFWSGQRRAYPTLKFVVILEDCESAIAPRSGENNEMVSVILNLSDGMLSDFLKIQIICTVNCRATEIDQALLRPGRLTSHRVFPRLSFAEAERLAERLGKRLPERDDYSLAEIFAGSPAAPMSRNRIGFAG